MLTIRTLENINATDFTEYKKVAAKISDPAIFLKMEGNNDEIRRSSENPPVRSANMNYSRSFLFLLFISMAQERE